jgi:hypothetical protein
MTNHHKAASLSIALRSQMKIQNILYETHFLSIARCLIMLTVHIFFTRPIIGRDAHCTHQVCMFSPLVY